MSWSGLRCGSACSSLACRQHSLAWWWRSASLERLYDCADLRVCQRRGLAAGHDPGSLFGGIPLGIAAGLFIGKQIGVFGFTYGAVRAGICEMPQGTNWGQIYGLAMLTGIGFTMSLFIGTLAFEGIEHASAVRLGVLSGSLFSALGGYLLLLVVGTAEPKAEALAEAGGESPPKSESEAPAGTKQNLPPGS